MAIFQHHLSSTLPRAQMDSIFYTTCRTTTSTGPNACVRLVLSRFAGTGSALEAPIQLDCLQVCKRARASLGVRLCAIVRVSCFLAVVRLWFGCCYHCLKAVTFLCCLLESTNGEIASFERVGSQAHANKQTDLSLCAFSSVRARTIVFAILTTTDAKR